MFKYTIIIFLMFSGCAYKTHTITDQKNYTTTINYNHFSKAAILNAAKKAFIFTNKDFVIDSYRNSLSVRKTVFSALDTSVADYIFYLTANERDRITKVTFYIKRINDVNALDFFYLDKDEHTIFFKRLNYFLSLEKEWTSCAIYKQDALYNSFCHNLSGIFMKSPKSKDRIKNIYIKDKQESKNIIEINNDILLNDKFLLSIKDNDILDKEDSIEINDKAFKDDINIDAILDKIEEETNKNLKKRE